MSARRKQPESQLQQWCVKWFRYQFPVHIIFAIPNGGKRNAREAAKMKCEGVLAGVADLFIAQPVKNCSGLFIEMKVKTGTQTESQKKFEADIKSKGFEYTICKDFDDFKKKVENYLQK